MKHLLNEIKSQLFDAPNEIKSSFNKVVSYFAEEEFDYTNLEEYIIASCEKSQDDNNPTNWKIKKVKGSELNKKDDKIVFKVLSKVAKVDKK